MSSLCIAFRDTVRLKDSRIGTVQFIGRTTVKKIIYYGIHLKQRNGSHDGSMHNRRYFKCPPNSGIFVEKSDITEITKKYTISASFNYNQIVIVTNIGFGIIKYIGMTHFGSSYWYGIELEKSLPSNFNKKRNKNNNHSLHVLSHTEINRFHYFDSDENFSIFVRQNQIKSAGNLFRRKPMHMESKMEEKEEKNDPYSNCDNYINKTLISMMDSLNIATNKRSKILSMDNKNKLLLIQQWFVTPNTKELQKTMNQNIKQRKKSQSLILLKLKNMRNKKKEHVHPDESLQLSPTQSSSNNLNFDGCKINISKNNNYKKREKSVKRKRKKSKSLLLFNQQNLAKNKKNISFNTVNPLYEEELKTSQSSKQNKRLKRKKKAQKPSKISHSLQLNEIKSENKPKTQKKVSANYLNHLKVANIKKKNNNINKSKSACLLIKKSNLENVKKTKSLKPNAKKKMKKKFHPKRKESKSAILLIKKSEKYKLKLDWQNSSNSNKKITKSKSKKSKIKSKKPSSAALLTVKDKGKNIKKSKSSVSLRVKSKNNSRKKKRKNRRILDKLID